MKKRKNKKKYISIIIIGLISIIIIYQIFMSNKFTILKGLSASIFNTKNYSKYKESTEIKELNKEIDKLKELNDINKLRTDKKIINASVSKRSTPYWHNYITINVGRKNGVKKGDAVINTSGLVGEVYIVNNNNSEVRLITNSDDNYISAKFYFNNKDYYGIIKRYNVINNELYLENVIGDLNKSIIGLEVVTSGLSSNMPSGLLIGKIKELKKDKYNLSNTIIIELSTDINDLDLVTVIGND